MKKLKERVEKLNAELKEIREIFDTLDEYNPQILEYEREFLDKYINTWLKKEKEAEKMLGEEAKEKTELLVQVRWLCERLIHNACITPTQEANRLRKKAKDILDSTEGLRGL